MKPFFRYLCSPGKAAVAGLLSAMLSLATAADLPIYADHLAADWVDWSWGTTRNLTNTTPVHSGTSAIAVTLDQGWGALYLHANTPVPTAGYSQLGFWVNGASAGQQKLQVVLNGTQPGVAFSAQAGVWSQVKIALSELGSPAAISDIYWMDASGTAQPLFVLDDIALLAGTTPGGSQDAGTGPTLRIDASADRHPINPDIYGINLLEDEALATELRLPLRRWGGNATSRYNWQNDTTNTGSDWYYENIPRDNPNPATLPDGSSTDRFVEQDRRTATRTLLTVPTLGWVAKRRSSGHPFDCGFKVSRYGAQQLSDPWDADCGNGLSANGSKLTGNDPTDTSTAVGPDFVADWVQHLVGKYGSAASGGVAYYAFDNEPMLWNSTHRDVHPQPTTFDEMRDRTVQYGSAIKAADPSAKTLGPAEWGWCGYLYSAADPGGCSAGADYQAHGNTPFVAWYLQQMRNHEQQHSVRILDYLDLHAYPYANGVALAPAGNAATQALRLRSTRSLWDPSYIDESWLSDTAPGGVALQLIPRMKQWVADNYPGTKLAITEYNYGAPESINGALAQADVLGIYGREGLDLATYWGDVVAMQPWTFALRLYRNYDGAGHGFGDTAVRAVSADQGTLAVYAAQRSADAALTALVINKSASALTSSVSLAGFTPGALAAVYRYSPTNLSAIERTADQVLTASGWQGTFAAHSITLLVLPASGTAPTDTDNCLFDWAERQFPSWFAPAGVASAGYAPYHYRFYPTTGNFLATSSVDRHVWVLGRASGNQLLDAGPAADWLGLAGCVR